MPAARQRPPDPAFLIDEGDRGAVHEPLEWSVAASRAESQCLELWTERGIEEKERASKRPCNREPVAVLAAERSSVGQRRPLNRFGGSGGEHRRQLRAVW